MSLSELSARELLLAMVAALDADDQDRYREAFVALLECHKAAYARARKRQETSTPHP